MMFATLDDLAGAVELLVFGKALAEHEAALAVDEVVLVKGRVDHKEAGKTCLVVQTVEAFAPSPEEIERARAQASASRPHRHRARAAGAPADARRGPARESAIDDLKQRDRGLAADRPRCSSTSTERRHAPAACAWARTTACSTPRRCAPSSNTRSRPVASAATG